VAQNKKKQAGRRGGEELSGDRIAGFGELASLLGAVAHPLRLFILRELISNVRCVKDLQELVPVSQPNLSQHMAALRKAGLVDSEVNGPLRCYYVTRPSLVRMLTELDPRKHPVEPRSRESVLTELEESR
jgi:ArsR family transcriptional regulator